MNIFKTKTPTLSTMISKLLETGSDEEILKEFGVFLDKVNISCQFVQSEDGLLTHQVLAMVCGDKVILSEPMALEWPLQALPIPESLQGRLN